MKRYRVITGLHNDAPKRVTRVSAPAIETVRLRVFTSSRSAGRITTTTPPWLLRHPQGITTVCTDALSFHPEKSLHRSQKLSHRCPWVRSPNCGLGGAKSKVLPTPGSPTVRSTPSTWPKREITTTTTSLSVELSVQIHLPGQPPRHPRTRAHDPTNITLQSRWIRRSRIAQRIAVLEPHGSPGEGA
jgi:hypothetical protein